MKKFEYTITDAIGIHARPAGELAKIIKQFDAKAFLTKNEKTVELSRLMAVMGLGVKCGQTVIVEVSGADEDAAYEAVKAFFESNL